MNAKNDKIIPEKEFENLVKIILKGSFWDGNVFAVGGYVRDEILGIPSKDLDVVVELLSERGKNPDGARKFCFWIFNLFKESISIPIRTGESYPIWRMDFKDNVKFQGRIFYTNGAQIEVADTMKESYPNSLSRQRMVEWAPLKDDVNRRDFTVNSLLKNLSNGEILDLTGMGKEDIKNGILRSNKEVDINTLFKNDALRMLRICRFAVKYGWKVPLSVMKAVKANANRIDIVSQERVRDELIKIMKIGKLDKAVKFMDATDLLERIFPEVKALKGVPQNNVFHMEGDAFRHTMMVLANAKPGVESQLSALLHDTGKATMTVMENGKVSSRKHEIASATITEKVLRRMKFDLDVIQNVKRVVEGHMRPHQLHDASVSGIRKFIRETEGVTDAILDLAEADEKGKIPQGANVPSLRAKVQEVRSFKPVSKNNPILNGVEIMDVLKIKPGKLIKEVQDFLFDLEDKFAENGVVLDKETAKKEILIHFV